MGRLVQNHSTHIEGLIKWLKKIAETPEIKTITPASLSKTNGKGEKLNLKITTATKEGFKLLARKGRLVQEVFLVTNLEKNIVNDVIDNKITIKHSVTGIVKSNIYFTINFQFFLMNFKHYFLKLSCVITFW